MIKIVIVAGGTGGHLFPAIAVGEELIHRGYEVHFITDLRCKKYLPKDTKLIFHIINSHIPPTKGILTKIQFLFSLLIAVYNSIMLLRSIKPRVIIGFGGYTTAAPIFSGLLLRIPFIIHESNYIIGKVNKFFLKFATKITLAYKETKNNNVLDNDKILIIGSVVRANIRSLKVKENFDNDTFRIFIFGGSQGAKVFSSIIPESIKILITSHPEIKLHITQQVSKADYMQIDKIYSELEITYQLSEFFYDMEEQYKKQDLLIVRAGASTIAELIFIGLPAVFIPLPSAAENHQFYNAHILEENGAGWCFKQNTLSPVKLSDKLLVLIRNRYILRQASRNLLKRKKDGTMILANTVEKIIG